MEAARTDLLGEPSVSQDFESKLLRHCAGKIDGIETNDIQHEWSCLKAKEPGAAQRMHSKFFGFEQCTSCFEL